jgi:osmotically-inducible protein OsmY
MRRRQLLITLVVTLTIFPIIGFPLMAQGPGEEFSDDQIKSAVVGEFFWDSRVDGEQIDVIVEDRLVILTGAVDSFSEVVAAEEIAESVQGVVSVENNLVVAADAPPEDGALLVEDRVERVLDVTVGLVDDTVTVESPSEGSILLEGSVDSYADKQRAVTAASNVVGVTEVIDNIAVTPEDSVTDEVIASDVVEAIRRTTTVALDTVDVYVSDGQVRLEGSLPTWNDVLAVVDAANYTLGVTEVVNNLTVEGTPEQVDLPDDEIRRAVRDQLVWDDRVDATSIEVDVENGFVTLSGTVDTFPESRAAVADARAVAGVQRVINDLEVAIADDPEGMESPTEAAIENALDWTESVDTSDIAVLYRDGTVLLEGSVPSLWEKNRVENLIADIRGVTEVDNRLTVVPTEDFDDEQIANRISNALTARLFLDAEEITVAVDDGVVELSGTVDSPVERRMAYNIALQTQGVVGLEQELEVGS